MHETHGQFVCLIADNSKKVKVAGNEDVYKIMRITVLLNNRE